MYTFPEIVNLPVIDATGNPEASNVAVGPLCAQSSPQQ
jgi:hypothetical protein